MKNNIFYHFFAFVLILFLLSCFGPTQSYPAIQQIIFISSRFGSNMEIYTMDRDVNNQINLTSHQSRDTDPQFSTSGSGLLFITNRNGLDEIYYSELEWYGGYTRYEITNQVNVSNHPAYDGQPQFSPDGSKIVFQSARDSTYEIYLVDIDGNNLANISNHSANDLDPQFPRMEKIFYMFQTGMVMMRFLSWR